MDEVAALLLLVVDSAGIQFKKHESLLQFAGGFFLSASDSLRVVTLKLLATR